MQNLGYYKNYNSDYKNSSLRLKLIKNINETLNIIMYVLLVICFCQFISLIFNLYSYYH